MAKQAQVALNDPWASLEILRRMGNQDHRKLRLFVAACCRRVWHLLVEPDSQDAVLVAEQIGEGRAQRESRKAKEGLKATEEKAEAAVRRLTTTKGTPAGAVAAAEAAKWAVHSDPGWAAMHAARSAAAASAESTGREVGLEGRVQMALLVDLHGNPLWPVALDPRWRTNEVVRIAQATYDNRIMPGGEIEPARLGVLADTLEEAGCTEASILAHLRGPGPHVRGCWPLDLVLAKE
jgi:hypothetical protein